MWSTLTLLAGCSDPSDVKADSSPAETSSPDSSGTTDSADTQDSGGPGHTGETDTADTAPTTLGALTLSVDTSVVTLLHATFTDPGASATWVEYRFDGGDWQVAPLVAPGDATLLGLPAETDVEARAAATFGSTTVYSDAATATTGSLPSGLPLPELVVWDDTLADSAGWMMLSVDGSSTTYSPPYWIEILDRQGRVVWYHEIPDELMCLTPSVARDGTHVWWDEMDMFFLEPATPRIVSSTLDGRESSVLPVDDLGQAVSEGPDGSFYYERRGASPAGVASVQADGTTATVWACEPWMADLGYDADYCKLNSCVWDEARNTVMASSFYADTAFEIDVSTGEIVRQMGQFPYGAPYGFDPSTSVFEYQHAPHWLDDGNLLVSTHVKDDYGVQVAAEYEVDDGDRTLHEVWSYVSPDRFATQLGEALRLPGGNTVQGYGEDGAVREVTPDGTVAWEVEWPPDDAGKRVVGHASFIEDLYALNGG